MSNFKQKLTGSALLFGTAVFFGVPAMAQEGFTTTGGDASGNGGSLSYSVGQVAYTYTKGNTASISQGVQQAYEFSEVTGTEEAEAMELGLSAYPNPTTDAVVLSCKETFGQKLTVQLLTIDGKLLSSHELKENHYSLNMSGLPAATYLLIVSTTEKDIKSFKIIKR